MKICSACNVEKEESEFRRRSDRPGGVGYHCKECACKKTKSHYQRNRAERLQAAKLYREGHKEEIKKAYAQWATENPEYQKEWTKNAYDNNPNFHMRCILRSRFLGALSRVGVEKDDSALELLGCPVWHLWAHFDFLFKPGMTRSNHGSVWEVDHIRPVASFDLTDTEQQKACFHWTNLQPLFVEDNRRKGCAYG